jgi:hypothetical protein
MKLLSYPQQGIFIDITPGYLIIIKVCLILLEKGQIQTLKYTDARLRLCEVRDEMCVNEGCAEFC